MRRLTILFFALNLAVGCGSAPKDLGEPATVIENRYFADASRDYVYKTAISVYGHDIGGILYIKKISAEAHRMVLTTEFGNTLLDATLENGKLSVNNIVEELDRKMLLRVLEADFGTLFREKYPVYVLPDAGTKRYNAIVGSENFEILYDAPVIREIIRSKRKPLATYRFEVETDIFATGISIEHHDLKLRIDLNKINP